MDTTTMRVLVDSLVYATLISVAILVSLYWNPRIWINDFPEVIRKAIPPLSAVEKRDRLIFVALLFPLIFALPLWMLERIEIENGEALAFLPSYLYLAALLFMFNLFDAVVIDLLIITLWQPKRLQVAGAENAGEVLRDPKHHLIPFAKGLVFVAVVGAMLSAISLLI